MERPPRIMLGHHDKSSNEGLTLSGPARSSAAASSTWCWGLPELGGTFPPTHPRAAAGGDSKAQNNGQSRDRASSGAEAGSACPLIGRHPLRGGQYNAVQSSAGQRQYDECRYSPTCLPMLGVHVGRLPAVVNHDELRCHAARGQRLEPRSHPSRRDLGIEGCGGRGGTAQFRGEPGLRQP